jgi:hypothetical protein
LIAQILRPSRFQNGVDEAFAMAVTRTLVGERGSAAEVPDIDWWNEVYELKSSNAHMSLEE